MVDQLGDILKRILPQKQSGSRLAASWRTITSETEARWSEATTLKKGTLYVLVKNSALYQELKSYRKVQLIEAWNKLPGPKITTICFKVV